MRDTPNLKNSTTTSSRPTTAQYSKRGRISGIPYRNDIDRLSLEFFSYLLTFIPDPTDPNWKAPPVDQYYMLRHPAYVGDYLNQVAYPLEDAAKYVGGRKYMVTLPTKALASAWGSIMER